MGAAPGDEHRVDRLRVLAAGVAGRIGGVPAVRTLVATLETYDAAGGGLVAGGLAYAALLALLPGLLLAVTAFGLLITDAATREQLVGLIAGAVPPLEELARTAFGQVSAGAVPLTVVGVIGLLWGASRFYTALDVAFARVFQVAHRRNELERTLRGVLVTGLLVVVPIVALLAGSLAGWIMELLGGAPIAAIWPLLQPGGSLVLFVGGTLLVYRFVPATRVPASALVRPGVLVGLALALLAQLFALIAPLMTRIASIYGPFVAVFGLLAWLSISFNVLLLGAAWTRVRATPTPADGS